MAEYTATVALTVKNLRQLSTLESQLNKVSAIADRLNKKRIDLNMGGRGDARDASGIASKKANDAIRGFINGSSKFGKSVSSMNSQLSDFNGLLNMTALKGTGAFNKQSVAVKQLATVFTQATAEAKKLAMQQENLIRSADPSKAGTAIQAEIRNRNRRSRVARGRERQSRFRDARNSALIGGGFPLLFGGGPLQAAAGAIGGGIGGSLGKGGGFAGSIAATAVVQTIQQTVTAIGNLGKAMGPFTQDTNALVNAMGLAGTAEGKRIEIIKELQGEQAAFNAVMQKMREAIGTEATKRLQDFGERASLVGSEFQIAMTKMQASLVPVINLVDQLLGISKGAQEAQRKRFIENTKNPAMVEKREEIERLKETTGGGRAGSKRRSERIKVLQEELDKMADIGIVIENQAIKMSEITLAHDKLVKKAQEEKDLKEAIAKLTKTGMSEAVAKEVAQREQVRDRTIEQLDAQAKILMDKRRDLDFNEKNKEEFEKIKILLDEIFKRKQKITEETKNATDALVDQGEAIKKVKVTKKEVADLLANEMANGIAGLIEGTKSLGDVLASVAKNLGSMFLQAGTSNLFSQIFKIPAQAQGGYNRVGGFKAFQYGGVVNSPTLGMIGEGGESEYVIPASKMAGAMQRYSSGARGGAVIPGGSGDAGTVSGSSGNAVVEYTGPVLNFNGDDYLPRSAVPDLINTAAKRGADAGQSKMMKTFKNSRSQRASIGL